ncbi:peptide/nickel transport system ATP-binding protein [Butyrivibrio proteoclasticus]|uniref:Peptide/nickel transport system ATP-binding protein n=1 Tax=Butyrivibrio proteoclasticus TaxID=43305 RepID=A0A1I5R6C7_9FIRM|nr:ATP-binding cassette domain-containing protein [Butyrivibrio proteoclasticus]SFP53851.1 peptide/nickel transport system ATP-binding protein [Butyrivibrio proteoclasticus]
MEESKVLKVENLNVYYKNRKRKFFSGTKKIHTLYDVSFEMEEGEVLAIAGESGCGKSTLARAIVGINKDYTGTLWQKYDEPQMVFQDPYSSLNPAKKIGWLLEEPLKVDKKRKWTSQERKKRVEEIMGEIELPLEMLDRYPSQLSGGQRQRICIGIALMKSPRLLIADEPVSALDVTIQAQIMELLQNLHKRLGISIIFISHDLRVVYQISDHVMIMKSGKVVEYGKTRDVYKNPQDEYTVQLLKAAGIRQ